MCLKCNSSGLTPSHVQVQVAKGAVESYCRSSKQRDQRVTMNSIKCTFPRGVKVSSVTSTLTSSCNHDAIITTGRERERELRSPSQPHSHLALMKETCSQCEGSLLLQSWGCSGAHSRGNWYIMKLKYGEVTWQPNGLVSLTKWLQSPATCDAAITSVTVVIYLLRCFRHSLMILANSFQINTSSSPFLLHARLIIISTEISHSYYCCW